MAEPSNLSLIIDTLELKTDGMQEKDGILSVPATVAKSMIQDYGGLKVLKPADELEAAAAFTDGIPITREHPPAGIVTDRSEVLGFLKNPLFENDALSGILAIADKDLAADVKDGKLTGLSIGFFCDLDRTEGTVGDTQYDAVQKDIFLNHVAIVNEGRCSIEDGCRFHTDSKEVDSPPDLIGKLDTAIGMASNEWGNNDLKDLLTEIKEMITTVESLSGDSAALQKVTAELDSLKADLKLSDSAALQKLTEITAERDSLKADLESIVKTEKDTLIAELTTMQDTRTKDNLEKLKLDELKKELDMVKEIRTDRLSFADNVKGKSSKSAIDDAYAGAGRKS